MIAVRSFLFIAMLAQPAIAFSSLIKILDETIFLEATATVGYFDAEVTQRYSGPIASLSLNPTLSMVVQDIPLNDPQPTSTLITGVQPSPNFGLNNGPSPILRAGGAPGGFNVKADSRTIFQSSADNAAEIYATIDSRVTFDYRLRIEVEGDGATWLAQLGDLGREYLFFRNASFSALDLTDGTPATDQPSTGNGISLVSGHIYEFRASLFDYQNFSDDADIYFEMFLRADQVVVPEGPTQPLLVLSMMLLVLRRFRRSA